MKSHTSPRSHGFTLMELICVIAIIGLLASLVFPAVARMSDRADVTKCTNNLRQIGMSINLYCAEHDNTLPLIETDPTNPVYPEGTKVQPIGEVLKPYGVDDAMLTCPADLKAKLNYKGDSKADAKSFFEEKHSSYEWSPLFDGEAANAPKFYSPRGAHNVATNRVRLLLDFVNTGEAPHLRAEGVSSTYYSLQGDGTVRTWVVGKAEVKR